MLRNPFRIYGTKCILRSKNSFSSLTCDVLVVGGGAHGANIAYQLTKKGINNVVVLEQDNTYRYASSVLSAGGIRQQFSLEENIRMSIYGANFLKSMPEELKSTVRENEPGENDPQFHQNGYLFLANEKSKHILDSNLKVQNDSGADWLYSMNSDELKVKFPWLNLNQDRDLTSYYKDILDPSTTNIPLLDSNTANLSGEEISMGVFSTKNEGYFDPWTLISATRNKAKESGVTFLHARGTGVNGDIKKSSVSNCIINNFYATLNSDQDVNNTLLKKNDQVSINSKVVVLASGAWTGELFSSISKSIMPVNPNALFPIPVKPRKRCIFMAHCPDVHDQNDNKGALSYAERQKGGNEEVLINKSPLVVDPTGCYFRPENKPGHFLFGVSPGKERDIYMAMRHNNGASKDPYTFHDNFKSYYDDIEKDLLDVDFQLFYDVLWPTMASRIPLFNNIKLISSWAGYYDVNTVDEVSLFIFICIFYFTNIYIFFRTLSLANIQKSRI